MDILSLVDCGSRIAQKPEVYFILVSHMARKPEVYFIVGFRMARKPDV